MIISIFFIDSYIDITLLSMYLLLTMLYSDIDIKVYLKNIYGIKIFLIFIFIIDLIFFTSINRIIFDIFKLIFIVLYSSILTYTTSITELTFGIEKLLRPFNKLIPVGDIAMIITLSIRYIPTLTEEASRIIKAQKLRGINFDTKNIKEKIISISGILMPINPPALHRQGRCAGPAGCAQGLRCLRRDLQGQRCAGGIRPQGGRHQGKAGRLSGKCT